MFYDAIANGSHRDSMNQSPQGAQRFLDYLDGKKSLPSCVALAPTNSH